MTKRNGIKFFFLVLLGLFSGLASSAYSEEAAFTDGSLGIPVHQQLKPLCGGNLLGQNRDEIVWQNYTSNLAPAALISDYQHKLGKGDFTQQGAVGTWKFHEPRKASDSTAPEAARILEISPVAEYRPHGSCEKKPPSQSLSIVEMSAFYQPAKGQ